MGIGFAQSYVVDRPHFLEGLAANNSAPQVADAD